MRGVDSDCTGQDPMRGTDNRPRGKTTVNRTPHGLLDGVMPVDASRSVQGPVLLNTLG